MRVLILHLLLCAHLPAFGQVTFLQFPADLQLYGRDLSTNSAIVQISGFAIDNSVEYDSLRIEVFRNNQSFSTASVALNYINDTAHFTSSHTITAELASYDFRVYGIENNSPSLINDANDVVAGDAFIISGQSNAEAKQRNESTSQLQNNFIRVYQSGNPNPSAIQNNHNWYVGQGDGNRFSNGNVGQWGIQFAHQFTEELQVPVAIFNGAHPAQPISFFQAPTDYASSLNSNYGRLFNRIENAGLQDHIRAVFWSQGEKNGLTGFSMSAEEYKQAFLDLKNSWQNDYPNIERYYIFQTNNGCDKPLANLMKVKEGQRQLALEDEMITTIPTVSLTHYSDDCHYDFTDGYEEFGKRLYQLVRTDLYGLVSANDLAIPNPIGAMYLGNNLISIETNSSGLWMDGPVETLLIRDKDNAITDIQVNGSAILLHLEKAPSENATITYFGPAPGTTDHFIRSANNKELLSFHNLPVKIGELGESLPQKESVGIYPNPAHDVLHISGIEHDEKAEVINLAGEVLFSESPEDDRLNIEPLSSGMYLLRISNQNGAITTFPFVKE